MLTLVILLVFLNGCKKDQDTVLPVINYELPPANIIINAGDTVRVRAIITDNEIVESINVTLVNDASVPLTTPVYLYPGTRDALIDLMYPVDNIDIPSGDYHILITASDGPNQKKQYRPVRISGAPLGVNGYIMVKRLNSSVSRIEVLDASFNPDTVFDIRKAYSLTDVNSTSGLFFFANRSPSRLLALNTYDYEEEWTVEASLPYPEYLHSVVDGHIYISSGNGSIGGFDSEGGNVFQTWPVEGYFPETFGLNEDYLVAEQVSRSSSNPFLALYYVSSGYERNRIQIFEDVAAICTTGSVFLLFMNSGMNGVVKSLDVDELIYTELRMLENVKFLDAVKVNENSFFVSTDDGIYEYEVNLNRFTFFKGLVPDLLRYDYLSERLFAVRGKDLFIIDLASGQQVPVIQSADPILGFHILYGK